MQCFVRQKDGYFYNISYGNIIKSELEVMDLSKEFIDEVTQYPYFKIYDVQGNLNQEHLDKYNKYQENQELLPALYTDVDNLKTEYQITDNDLTAINLDIASQEVIDNYKAYYLKANELQQEINNLESENKEILNDIYVGDTN